MTNSINAIELCSFRTILVHQNALKYILPRYILLETYMFEINKDTNVQVKVNLEKM